MNTAFTFTHQPLSRLVRALPLLALLPLLLPAQDAVRGPGRPPGPDRPPFNSDGPWNHRILLASSSNGLEWKLSDTVLADHASVPELFAGPDGRAIILFVDAETRRGGGPTLGALVETDGKKWEKRPTNLRGVDPNVVALTGGGYRAYVKAGFEGAIDVWRSTDGLQWQRTDQVFRDERYPLATDPDVFETRDGWVMLLSLGPQLLRCTSRDGLTFVAGEILDWGGSVSDTVAVDGGWRTFFHVNGKPEDGTKLHIRSAFTADGRTWKVEDGVRLAAPADGPARLGVGDPAPLRRADGTWLMAVKSMMNEPRIQPGGPSKDADLQRRVERLERELQEIRRRLDAR
jgi:hypothetical protein